MILFAHIEKCGGTSIHDYLKTKIDNYLILRPTPSHGSVFTKQKLKLIRKIFPNINGFGGHRILLHENYENINEYMVCIRNPVSRYSSHLIHQLTRGIIDSKDDFLSNQYFNNFICKRICGKECSETAISLIESKNVNVFVLERDFNNLKKINTNKSDLKIDSITDIENIVERNLEDIKLYNYFNKEQKNNSFKSMKSSKNLSNFEIHFIQRIVQTVIHFTHGGNLKKTRRGL